MNGATTILRRLDALGAISDSPSGITRLFGSPAMRRATRLVDKWMGQAGMKTRVDAIGNLRGHYAAKNPAARVLLLGSHLDTVPNAGKFDGVLGVLLAIACVESLHGKRLPFALEVIAFADEEGIRFRSACLGSKAVAGCFDDSDLALTDARGVTMAEAIRCSGGNPDKIKASKFDAKNLLGYLEAHIEQGPVLEQRELALGIVTAIAGQTRANFHFHGRAGHAGTTPMHLRHDALCAGAEFILAVEARAKKIRGLVATVGEISATPGASNVIPAQVVLSLDLRHPSDSVRRTAYSALRKSAAAIAHRRRIRVTEQIIHQTRSVHCSRRLSKLLSGCVRGRQNEVLQLPSGAGHDAAIMARIAPVVMLFIRCKNGVSHHPDEFASAGDVQCALEVMNDFIAKLARTR